MEKDKNYQSKVIAHSKGYCENYKTENGFDFYGDELGPAKLERKSDFKILWEFFKLGLC